MRIGPQWTTHSFNWDFEEDQFPPTEGVERFLDFMRERHRIYIRYKVLNLPPDQLTDDPIFSKYKFTNVFRELDTGTIWCRENIREPYADHPELFFNIALYRVYNRITTAEALGFIEDYPSHGAEEIVREIYNAGNPVFTGAYMLTGTLGGDKIHQVFNVCANYLWEHRRELEPKPGDTLEKAFNRINDGGIPGIGPFISYEIVSDLRWTRYLRNAADIMTWANPGPGAKRGIKRVYMLPTYMPELSKKKRQEVRDSYPNSEMGMLSVMRYLLYIVNEIHHPLLPGEDVPKLEMREIEHSLCEFDKYERVRLGEGRPRSVFRPS